jgi:DNA-binding NtrC family response regulator
MGQVSNYPVLLIDDETQYLQSAAVALRVAGLEVATLADPRQACQLLSERQFGVILLDILMPGLRGDALLAQIQRIAPHTPVVMVTAVNDLETAVGCMRRGAFDYLVKPVEKDRLVTTVRRALEIVELRSENQRLKEGLLHSQLKQPEIFEGIVTRDPQMLAIFKYIEATARTPMPVLIRGETGTGKELIALAVHRASGRGGEFVCVNAAGMTDTLFNDALFGHEKGAFTGADSRRAGLVAKAAGGTLFLDEIGDLSAESQVRLLRLLEERTYYPAGSDTPRSSDARIIAATNRPIETLRSEGRFRDDLYYRLEAHIIDIPPLRQRSGDIPLLIDHFTELAAQQIEREPPEITEEVYAFLCRYPFAGNIRELRNILADAVSIAGDGCLTMATLPPRLTQSPQAATLAATPEFGPQTVGQWQTLPALKEAENLLIDEALRRSNGNQTVAAQLLGLTRSALNKRLIRAKQEPEA